MPTQAPHIPETVNPAAEHLRHTLTARWLAVWMLLLAGLALGGKGTAYIGLPPIFISEVVLICGCVLLCFQVRWRDLVMTPTVVFILAFIVWGVVRTLPYLGTYAFDALRDGVDVPGRSLRCVVMESVPWPRPTILHRARRAAAAEQEGGAKRYDDRIIRARLAQAFGRLIRTREDSGHFVVLSPAFPSRLLSAFPEGTPVTRLTLEEALQRVANGVVSADLSTAETLPQ